MLDPDNIDTCTVCNERKECNLNNKLSYSSETVQTSLNKHLGPGVYVDVCLDCKSLVDLIEFFSLQLKLKISELKTLFNNGQRKKGKKDCPQEKEGLPVSKKKRTKCNNCGKNFSARVWEKHQSICLKSSVICDVKQLPETPPVSESSMKLEDRDWITPKVEMKVKVCRKRGRPAGTGKQSDRALLCEYCNKSFKSFCDFENHRRSHTGEKPFQCENCGATFSQRQNLRTHVRTKHNKEKRYSCEVCQKKFSRRRLLDCHVSAKHNSVRPYKCLFCEARFAYPGREKTHAKSCPGLRVMCYRCGKPFSQTELKKHDCRDEDGKVRKGLTFIIKETDIKESDLKILERMESVRKAKRDEMIYVLPFPQPDSEQIQVKPDPDLIRNRRSPNNQSVAVENGLPEGQHVTSSKEANDPKTKEQVTPQHIPTTVAAAGAPSQFEVENAVFSIVQG